jgi:hypothetical protein
MLFTKHAYALSINKAVTTNGDIVTFTPNKELLVTTEERKKVKAYLDANKVLLKDLQEETSKLLSVSSDLEFAKEAVLKELVGKYEEYADRLNKIAETLGARVGRDCRIKLDAVEDTTATLTEVTRKLGTQVKVGGVVFASVRGAAAYIVAQETLKGNSRNIETVRKEVKRIASYEVPSRLMYDAYEIEAL